MDHGLHVLSVNTLLSLQSRKLHSFSGRANTRGVNSRMIFARSFWVIVVYHLLSRTLPCRLSNNTNLICITARDASSVLVGKCCDIYMLVEQEYGGGQKRCITDENMCAEM